MANEKFYMVFKAQNQREHIPSDGMLTNYSISTVVRAEDEQDAVEQVAAALGIIGGFVAIECTPIALNLTPRRLEIEGTAMQDEAPHRL